MNLKRVNIIQLWEEQGRRTWQKEKKGVGWRNRVRHIPLITSITKLININVSFHLQLDEEPLLQIAFNS